MKKLYKITSEEGQQFAAAQLGWPLEELDEQHELEVTQDQEKALIAAGWIEGPIEPKSSKGGKS